jgi:outer membrane protein TolC
MNELLMNIKRFRAAFPFRKVILSLFIVFFLCHTGNLCAQENKDLLSLSKAIETADANYGAVKAKDFYVKAQEENIKQVRREYLPSLKLHEQVNYATANSVTGTYFPSGVVVPISGGINRANNFNPVYGSLGMGYLEWAPFSFGQFKAKVDESKIKLSLYSADAEQEKFFNHIYVTQAYLDALVASRLRTLQLKNLERTLIVHDVVRLTALNGLRAGVDTSFLNAEVARARINVMEAEKNEAEQRKNLADLMGVETAANQLDTTTFFLAVPSSTAAISPDITTNPLLKLYIAQRDLSANREKEIFRNYFPKLSLLGVASGRGSGILYNGTYDESFSGGTAMSRFNYGGAITCTFNILDYPRMRSEQAAERYKTEAAKTQLDEKTLDLKNDLTLANEKLRIALEQMKQVPIQYQSALDFYNQKLAMYKNGLATIIDLSQALYNLSRAEADNAISRDAVWKALLLRASVSGDFTSFLNNIKTK